MLVNAARGLTKAYGERLRGCNARGMTPKADQDVSPELRSAAQCWRNPSPVTSHARRIVFLSFPLKTPHHFFQHPKTEHDAALDWTFLRPGICPATSTVRYGQRATSPAQIFRNHQCKYRFRTRPPDGLAGARQLRIADDGSPVARYWCILQEQSPPISRTPLKSSRQGNCSCSFKMLFNLLERLSLSLW
jgi:hypothetical protein